MITKLANPRNAQLGKGDTLPIRYGRYSVHKLQVVSDILGPVAVSAREAGARESTYIILEAIERIPEITFFKVLTVLDMTGEQSTTKRAVGGQEGGDDGDRLGSAYEYPMVVIPSSLQVAITKAGICKLPTDGEGIGSSSHHLSSASRRLEGLFRSRLPQ